jgi:heat-inducible transcriptional repressor
MRNAIEIELSSRQRRILRGVVEEYVASRQPVGSRTLVERVAMNVSPSTVRSELAELERLGLLTHPHTSAGRVPTERGYRYYADRLLERLDPQPGGFPLDLTRARNEVDSACRRPPRCSPS